MPGPPIASSRATGSGIDDAWARAATALGAQPQAAALDGAELASNYAQPHRRYHHAGHICAVLRDSDWLAEELNLTADERSVLVLAVCAHDVVYDADPGADERASAHWAQVRLNASGVAPRVADQVSTLVLATIEHTGGTDDVIADALLDADLAILAASPIDYAAYVEAVRAEYAAVSDVQWRHGRSAVLTALLTRSEIYRSAPAQTRWRTAARANLRAELTTLESR